MEAFSDIEALALRCRSDQSRGYISEAILCYRTGAFRSAIVSTWIAVAFDLIEKIRELSLSGDAAAKALEEKHAAYLKEIEKGNTQGISNALEFEREILECCHKQLQFFDTQQLIDLRRLKEDRNRCAHPSFQTVGMPYSPSAEHARLHIRNAIVHVLAQPPVQGKAALDKLKNLVASDYFPEDEEKAALQLKKVGLENPTQTLVKYFIDQLAFSYFDEASPLFKKKQVITAINSTHALHPGITEDRLKIQINKITIEVPDDLFDWTLFFIANTKPTFGLLDQPSKHKIEQHITIKPAMQILPAINNLLKFEELVRPIKSKLQQLSIEELAEAITHSNLRPMLKERALQLLSESKSWDKANWVFFRAITPLMEFITSQDIYRIIEMPTTEKTDLLGAHGYTTFINKVRELNLVPEEKLNKALRQNKAEFLIPPPPQAMPE